MKRTLLAGLVGASTLLVASQPARAIIWTDLTATTGAQPVNTPSGTVTGTVGGVGVTYSGSYSDFTQVNGVDGAGRPSTDYWNPFPSVDRPTGTDIITIYTPGTKTITFSQAVTDVYIAINSWNGLVNVGGNIVNAPQTALFNAPFTVVAEGAGFWSKVPADGPFAFTITDGGYGFTSPAKNEVHGLLKFTGTFTSLTFTDSLQESWHGIQIGIGSVPTGSVPEPASWAMMIGGFALVGATMRRRTTRVSFG